MCAILPGILVSAGYAEAIRVKTNWGQRVDLAARIIVGEVVAVESAWDPEHASIQTHVRIHVEEYVKGSGPEDLTVTVPGGRVGDTEEWVSDAPRFVAGERCLILLNDSGHAVGGPDGVFSMERTGSGSLLQWLRAYLSGDPDASTQGPRLGPGVSRP
jgi:hypothetical protein